MPMSRAVKTVMRSAKSPKQGTCAPGDESSSVLKAGKQYKQTGNKSNPSAKKASNAAGNGSMKLIV